MLSPMMQCAGRIRVKDCPFGAPDGTANQFQLVDRHGHAVTRDVRIQSIHQTDWQGRVELSSEPRTNSLLSPSFANGVNNNAGLYSVTPTDPIKGVADASVLLDTSQLSDAAPFINYTAGANIPSTPGIYSFSVYLLKDTADTCKMLLPRPLDFPIVTDWRVISGPGICVNDTVSGLSDTEPTRVAVVFNVVETPTLWAGPGLQPATRSIGESIIAGGAMLCAGTGALGAYIPTTDTPVTVTDYTHDGAGGITTGQVPADGATLDWTGSARRAA